MITATTVYFNQSTIIFFDSMTPESLLIMMFSVLLIVGSIASSSRIASFFSFFFYRFITFILKAFFSAFAMLIAKESNLSSHYSFGALLFGWWIVASILSWIPWIRALIFSRSFKLQKQINQESTVTKTLANLFSLGVGIAGFNDLSQDVPGEKHLIVVVSVIVVRIWLSFMFSSMVLFIEKEAFRACSWRRKLHKQLPGRFRNIADHEEDVGYEIEYEHLHEFYDQIESSFYDESGHHLVEFSSSYESGHHPVESSSQETGRSCERLKVRVVNTFCKIQVDYRIQDMFNRVEILKFWYTPVYTFSRKGHGYFNMINHVETTRLLPLMWIRPKCNHRILTLSKSNLEECDPEETEIIENTDFAADFDQMIDMIEEMEEQNDIPDHAESLQENNFEECDPDFDKMIDMIEMEEENDFPDVEECLKCKDSQDIPDDPPKHTSDSLQLQNVTETHPEQCYENTDFNMNTAKPPPVLRRSLRLKAMAMKKNKKKNQHPAVQDTPQNVPQVLRRSSRLMAKSKQPQKLLEKTEKTQLRRSKRLAAKNGKR